MSKSFSEAFNEHLARTGEKVADIATRAGVKRDALYSLKYGKSLNMAVDDAIRVAHAFGETVEEFMGLTATQARSSLIDQIQRLSPREQQILEASISAILAQRDVPDEAGSADEATALQGRKPKDG